MENLVSLQSPGAHFTNKKVFCIDAIKWTIDWYKQDPLNQIGFTLEQIKN